MINVQEKNKCCGCMACVSKCPKDCIEMKEDKEGFLYPIVDKSKCMNCGICNNVCPIENNIEEENEFTLTYIAYVKDFQIRTNSSSGGIFSILAEEVLNDGGIVFGAAYDEEFLVHHIAISKLTDLPLLRGSKYLQSRMENSYKEAAQFLNQGKRVLFVGTACQIAGLNKFLGKRYDKLLTVDILCHGVPSPKVWKKYLEDKERTYHERIKKISFRSKEHGWKDYSLKIEFESGEVYSEIFRFDTYMKLFLKNICLRPSCYDCQFKNMNRPSDLTIGDSWGIGKYMPDMDDDKGTSIVIIHTENGKNIFKQCEKKMIFKQVELEEALPKTSDSRQSVKMPMKRDLFFSKFNAGADLNDLVKLVRMPLLVRIKKKIVRKMKAIIQS